MNQNFEETDINKIRAKAREQALSEFRDKARQDLHDKILAEERAKLLPKSDSHKDPVAIKISVPPNMFINLNNETGIKINGKDYIHGQTYVVERGLANDMNHIMAKANYNERSLGSPHRDLTRKNAINAPAGKVLYGVGDERE
jgi:hypothetical protein